MNAGERGHDHREQYRPVVVEFVERVIPVRCGARDGLGLHAPDEPVHLIDVDVHDAADIAGRMKPECVQDILPICDARDSRPREGVFHGLDFEALHEPLNVLEPLDPVAHFVLQSFSISFSSATMISALLRHRLAWRSSSQMSHPCRSLSHSLSDLLTSSSLPTARSIQSAGPHA